MKRIRKMTNVELVSEYTQSLLPHTKCSGYASKLKEEILRRLVCYQFAVKPLNKKLYKKVIIKI